VSTLTHPRHRTAQRAVVTAGLLGLAVALSVAALFGAAANPPCTTPTTAGGGTGGGAHTFTAPLSLQVGRAYAVGATAYGGPRDPTSGEFGSSGTFLPGHPDSFAELSLLDANPANGGGSLSFQDADALGALPYGTPVRVTHDRHELTLVKEDIGYGQGPGQSTPYRLDVWWQAAARLAITKSTVEIQRLPATGSGAVLDQLPAGTQAATASSGCATATTTAGTIVTPITSGQVAQINPLTGIASAPVDAPAAVKAAIAAGNQLIDRPYIWGGGHANLDQLAAGYDCSGSAEYVLHHAGLYNPTTGPSSSAFEDHYPSGAGRWITVYANAEHMWIVVAGIVLNTAYYSTVAPTSPDSGPRWQPATTIQQQIAGNTAAGYPAFAVTHPAGF
jgi:hypothetical protein